MKHLFPGILFLFLSLSLFGQESSSASRSKKQERKSHNSESSNLQEEGVIRFKKHLAGGLKLINDGAAIFAEKAIAINADKAWLFQIEISERKHPKEEKLQNDYSPTAPVIYGKINYFYPVKLGVQKQYLLGNKGNKNGLCLTANFGGGISLAVLRPYLVQADKGAGNYEFVGYNSPDSNYFLNGPIVGGPSFSIGWSQTKIKPGLYAKSGLRFDYGRYNEVVSGLEIGATAELYPARIPQMIRIKQHPYFLGAYVTMIFGRRK